MPEKFVQTSTESRRQLKEAKKQERTQADQDKFDLQGLLDDPRFRRFCWRVLAETRMFEDVWDPNGSLLNKRVGAQSIGHWLWLLLDEARPDVMLAIMAERYKEA